MVVEAESGSHRGHIATVGREESHHERRIHLGIDDARDGVGPRLTLHRREDPRASHRPLRHEQIRIVGQIQVIVVAGDADPPGGAAVARDFGQVGVRVGRQLKRVGRCHARRLAKVEAAVT